mmetsp:Transcript_28217/g.65531  ORF Transcript_28217/g.65531 Transcript_28217/m.65531 type:complete len:129 (-) Transcript_28217:63-449(-)
MSLQWASDELLEDETFAQESKAAFYILKVATLSGRSCISLVHYDQRNLLEKSDVLFKCLEKLDMLDVMNESSGGASAVDLLYGAESVPDDCGVQLWPGSPSPGKVTEYQLVVAVSAAASAKRPRREKH